MKVQKNVWLFLFPWPVDCVCGEQSVRKLEMSGEVGGGGGGEMYLWKSYVNLLQFPYCNLSF